MSTNLTLHINADTQGLTEIKKVLRDLKSAVGPASAVATGFKDLKRDSLALKLGMANLTESIGKLDSGNIRAKKGTDKLGTGLKELAGTTQKTSKVIDLSRASLAELAASSTVTSQALRIQKLELLELHSQMAAFTGPIGTAAAKVQSLAKVTDLLSKEFQNQVAVYTAINAKTNEKVALSKTLTQTLLTTAVAQKKLTETEAVALGATNASIVAEAKYQAALATGTNVRSGYAAAAMKEESAALRLIGVKTTQEGFSKKLAASMATEAAATAVATAATASYAAASMRGAASAQKLIGVKAAGEAFSKKLAASMAAESQAILATVAASTLALQIAKSSASADAKVIKTLKAKALAAANAASALGLMTVAEVEALAVTNGLASSLTTRLTPALKRASVSTTGMRDATRGAAAAGGSLFMAYGQILPMLGAYATVASTIAGTKISAEFESQTVYMNAVAEAGGDYSMTLSELQTKLLGFKDLAHGPIALADASKELVKAGFNSVQATSEIADMSKTATIAQEDLSMVTKGVAAQFRAWGESSVGAERGVSSLKQTANMMSVAALATSTDFGELNQMLAHTTELGPLTEASFSQILAALGHMSNMGIKGTKAATSLRTAMLRLENQSPTLQLQLERLNVPFSALSNGKLKDLPTLFEDLGASLQGLTSESRLNLLDDIFNLRAMKGGVAMLSAMSKSVGEGSFSFKDLEVKIREAGESLSFVDGIYAKLSDTTGEQLAQMKADISKVFISAFNDSNGAVKDLITSIREMAADGSLRTIADGLAGMAESFLWAAKKAVEFEDEIIAVGAAFLTWKIGTTITGMVAALNAARVAQIRFNIAAALNPYVLMATAIAGVLVYSAMYIKDLKEINEESSKLDIAANNIINSFDGWKSVFAGDISFFDFATMNAEDLAESQKYLNSIEGISEKIRRKTTELWEKEAEAGPLGTVRLAEPELRAEIAALEAMKAKLTVEERLKAAGSIVELAPRKVKKSTGGGGETLKLPVSIQQQYAAETNSLKILGESEQARFAQIQAAYKVGHIDKMALVQAEADLKSSLAQVTLDTMQAEYDLNAKLIAEVGITDKERQALTEKNKLLVDRIDLQKGLVSQQGYMNGLALEEAKYKDRILTSAAKLKETVFSQKVEQESITNAYSIYQAEYESGMHTKLEMQKKEQEYNLSALQSEYDIIAAQLLLNQAKLVGFSGTAQELADLKAVNEELARSLSLKAGEIETQKSIGSTVGTTGLDGVTSTYGKYIQDAADDFTNFGVIAQNALQGTEDALVSLATGGKVSFRDMANSILADIARLAAKKMISSLLSSGTAAVGAGAATSAAGGGWGAVASSVMGALVKHDGGRVGSPSATRNVNPAIFSGAPRFHDGLKSDEFPAILQKGEEVTSKQDVQAQRNSPSNDPSAGLNIINVVDPAMVEQYMSSSAGTKVILNSIANNSGEVKGVLA